MLITYLFTITSPSLPEELNSQREGSRATKIKQQAFRAHSVRKTPLQTAATNPFTRPVFNYFLWSANSPGTPCSPGAVPVIPGMPKPLQKDLIFQHHVTNNPADIVLTAVDQAPHRSR